ncbi:MAG TPA: hypothetical protein DCS97_03340 [Planctomycetes bacterium]|nr:hypothetical protein [Planctomycetota bacterium]
MSDQQEQKNIAQGLSQLGETTTAAELLRQKGQTKKLRVISEKQLMEWILKLISQHMASKADAFSDLEKAELLKKTQEELNRRIKREQEAQADRDRMKAELDQAMAAVSQVQSGAASQADVEMALAALKEKLEQAEQINLDLQQDNYDLQDQLNEKMALLSTTIAEKDKLRETVRHQMMRMTTLCEGVLGIDNDYYGSRHQEENPVSDEAGQDEAFYHDFDVGAKVITTLQADLTRLRGIAQHQQEEADQKAGLLEADLALLEQLKAGNLHAVDVAAPVAGLVEAMEGARCEAEAFEQQVAEATGSNQQQTFTELPDATGDAAEVLAGATSVVRELAASLARNRNRIAALKSIADESDEARHSVEEELEAEKAALERVCTALRQRAEVDRLIVPGVLANREAPADQRAAACSEIVDQLQVASPVEAAAMEQLALTDRLVKPGSAAPVESEVTDKQLVAERLRKAGAELERYTVDLQKQLEYAAVRERALAEAVRTLAARDAGPDAPAVRELERSLELKTDPQLLNAATAKALDVISAQGGQKAAQAAALAEDRAIAQEVIKASQGDTTLADSAADLSIAADNDAPQQALGDQVREAIAALGKRRANLEEMLAAAQQQLVTVRSDQDRESAETLRLQAEIDKARAEAQKSANEILRQRSGREAALAALDSIALELQSRVPEAHRDLTDRHSEPQARAAAALAALAKMTEARPIEAAAIEATAAIDRTLGRTGATSALASDLRLGDEQQTATRLREASLALESRITTTSAELEASRARERDLAKQVRELAAAQVVNSASTVSREGLTRLEKAIVDGGDMSEAARSVVADLRANVGKSEDQARFEAARAVAAELVRTAENDPVMAEAVADLAVSIDGDAASSPTLVEEVRDAVTKLSARKRTLEAEKSRLAADLESARTDRTTTLAKAEADGASRQAELARLQAELAHLTEQLEEAQAEASEFKARCEATGTQFSGDMVALRQENTTLRQRQIETAATVTSLRQAIEANDVRLKRQREELSRGLAERDQLIADKDRTIDQLSNQRIDGKALEAKVQALTADLDSANDRIRQLEGRFGDQAGQIVKTGDLAELHKRTMTERDQLREQKRSIEGDLADSKARIDELATELAELRKEHKGLVESHALELTTEREKAVALQESLRKFKEEIIGLRARQRKVTEPK